MVDSLQKIKKHHFEKKKNYSKHYNLRNMQGKQMVYHDSNSSLII